jgi:hypothetical protein
MGVNAVKIEGSDAGSPVRIGAEGTDTNISITFAPKGSGQVSSTADGSFAGGYRQTIDGWYYENAAANLNNQVMNRLAGTTNNATGWIAPRAGSVTGIAVHSNAARTGGTLTAKVFKNGAQLGALTAVLDGTNTTFKATTQAKDTDNFNAGDILDIRIATDSGWSPTTADIRGVLEVET